ncbi:PDDEXK nuclease domain-containing protein [Herbiconiux sp. VKM Ac-2851]|uniref:PDDEXK nuclease domain-containing protein n=1 Tax=Herbiconiux sp. VKM Ac-2851 TaxID=2739025 RepID=UPI001565A0A0|nr:PDDEXK nuclease domain-containing protein [Herbiconiux sp. VKM Ac-2851]NQX37087.1 DUF1016 family protein [Herbiconiux sp. VKM Ac-2851]
MVVELKTGKLQPGYAGKLGFYVALVDDRLRRETHAPTVGILICGSRNEHTVRCSLGRTDSPMAASTYTYESLPASEQAASPTPPNLQPRWNGISKRTEYGSLCRRAVGIMRRAVQLGQKYATNEGQRRTIALNPRRNRWTRSEKTYAPHSDRSADLVAKAGSSCPRTARAPSAQLGHGH